MNPPIFSVCRQTLLVWRHNERGYRAYSILRNETKRNEAKYMREGEKMLINLNTA